MKDRGVIKPKCRVCGRNLPQGSPFGSVHRSCYDSSMGEMTVIERDGSVTDEEVPR
jgi:hypothetical protein